MNETETAETVQQRALRLMREPRVRFAALILVGIAAWILVTLNYPLEPAVPRYADF